MYPLQQEDRKIPRINTESFHQYKKVKEIVIPKKLKDKDIFDMCECKHSKNKKEKKPKKDSSPSYLKPQIDLKNKKNLTQYQKNDIGKKYKSYSAKS